MKKRKTIRKTRQKKRTSINITYGIIVGGIILFLLIGRQAISLINNTNALGTPTAFSYSVTHVIFNTAGLNLYTTGILAPYVHPQDAFMLVSGNNTGSINTATVNSWAATLRAKYPPVMLYAATSGIDNIRNGAPGLDKSVLTGLMLIYEANQENAPEFTRDMGGTTKIWQEAASIMRANGLQAWGKPSGRALQGRDHAGAWDYGVLATIMDGMNVQTQGSCANNTFALALDDLMSQYRAAQATSDLFVQVTVASNQINHSPPAQAIECSKLAWSIPEIDGVTVWMATDLAEEVKEYLELREVLLGMPPVVNAGSDQTISFRQQSVNLDGTVTDDGLPNPPGMITTSWTRVSGLGTVIFANPSLTDTTATFSASGAHVLRLSATDGYFFSSDDITITIKERPIGTSLYVDPVNGSDSNSGTSLTAPLGTIQRAVDLAQAGDRINLLAGTYLQDVVSKRDGTAVAPIIIRGPSTAVVKGGGNARIFEINHDYIVLNGFTIDGLHDSSAGLSGYRDKLIYVLGKEVKAGVTGLKITSMTLKNAGDECVRFRYFAQNNKVANSAIGPCGIYDFVFSAGGKNGEGIYIGTAPEQLGDGNNPTSDPDQSNNNWIYHNTFNTEGNECVDIKESASGNIIGYNICTGQKDPDSGGMDSRGNGNIFRSNEIYGNAGAGVRLGGDTELDGINNDVYLNNIHDNQKGGIKFQRIPQGKVCGNTMSSNTGGDSVGSYGSQFNPTMVCPDSVSPPLPTTPPLPTVTAAPTVFPTPTLMAVASSLPTVTPTPIRFPCIIIDAFWDAASREVLQGTTVKLTVRTSSTESCNDKKIVFDVRQDNGLLPSLHVDANPPQANIIGGIAQTDWIGEYHPNGLFGLFEFGSPHYFFNVKIQGEEAVIGSNEPNLEVNKAMQQSSSRPNRRRHTQSYIER